MNIRHHRKKFSRPGDLTRPLEVRRINGKQSGEDYQFQWPHGLRRRSAAAPLLRLWVRIPLGAWMSICGECCVR